ncbi:hypothetical protein DWW69_17005 [Bacteroides sp. AF16-49]|nr:hypothetical protein DXB63_14225 [Bacteroides sp. OM05-12]RHR72066.1 hypothetical protein DWW69_17005 [Bacteroides sp. AF16-49]
MPLSAPSWHIWANRGRNDAKIGLLAVGRTCPAGCGSLWRNGMKPFVPNAKNVAWDTRVL